MIDANMTDKFLKAGDREGLVVALNKIANERPSYYMVSGIGGHVISFQIIAKHISDMWNGFGLMYPAFFKKSESEATVESIADDMYNDIVDVQKDGNFLLAGYSMGAYVCLEVARRLRSEGEKVGIVIIDQRVPNSGNEKSFFCKLLVWSYWRLKILIDRFLYDPKKESALQRKEGLVYHKDNTGKGLNLNSFERVISEGREAVKNYKISACDIPAVLLRVDDLLWYTTKYEWASDYGWSDILDVKSVTYCEGDHLTIIKGQNAKSFGKNLETALNTLKRSLGE